MRFSTKTITTCAVLAALALALSYLESFFPPLLPLPGVKLGLANIVTVYALYALGASSALAILVVRCLLGSLFAGNASALLFSLLGGLAAMLVMIALHALPRLSVYGVSVGGAAAHNCGQVAAAMLTLGSAAPLAYLPFLLLVSLFTGALTGGERTDDGLLKLSYSGGCITLRPTPDGQSPQPYFIVSNQPES